MASLKGEIRKIAFVFAFIFTLLVMVSFVFSEERYLCITEKSTGFYYNKELNRWMSTDFKPDDKYIISRNMNGESQKYVMKELGKEKASMSCDDDFDFLGYLNCKGISMFRSNRELVMFRFNKKNGRFIYSYLLGYVEVLPEIKIITDEITDTPSISIGKCSPF